MCQQIVLGLFYVSRKLSHKTTRTEHSTDYRCIAFNSDLTVPLSNILHKLLPGLPYHNAILTLVYFLNFSLLRHYYFIYLCVCICMLILSKKKLKKTMNSPVSLPFICFTFKLILIYKFNK